METGESKIKDKKNSFSLSLEGEQKWPPSLYNFKNNEQVTESKDNGTSIEKP